MSFAQEMIYGNLRPLWLRNEFKKSAAFRRSSAYWTGSGINKAKNIGMLMDGVSKLPAGSDIDDWILYYHEHIKSWENSLMLMERMAEAVGISLSDAVNVFIIRALDNSFAGFQSELGYLDILKNEFGASRVRPATPKEDFIYGVDIVILDILGKIRSGIQVKKRNYFFSKDQGIMNERNFKHPEKHQLWEAATGKKVFMVLTCCIDDILAGRKAIEYIKGANLGSTSVSADYLRQLQGNRCRH